MTIVGQGNIKLTISLSTTKCLACPQIVFQSDFINQINKNLNCLITIFDSCVFQDQTMGKTIGVVKKKTNSII